MCVELSDSFCVRGGGQWDGDMFICCPSVTASVRMYLTCDLCIGSSYLHVHVVSSYVCS